MRSSTTLSSSLVLVSLLGPSWAQERVPTPAPEVLEMRFQRSAAQEDALREAIAAAKPDRPPLDFPTTSHLLAGEPITVGPDFKALYAPEGVDFWPALGKQAPASRHLSFRFEGAHVGGVPLAGLDLAAAPELDGQDVVFDRGAGLTEIYRPQGGDLEQLFVLEVLPSRSGDLVVRGAFETDLALTSASAEGAELRFAEPGIATVQLDKVIGIDARGERVEGSLRLAPDALEIVLPASFVATAELPVVVDPLIGVEYVASTGSYDADQVDIAFGDSFYDEYAVTYCRYYSATDPDIMAVTYVDYGSVGLAAFAIESTIGTFDQEPSIAYNAGEEQFAVAWERSSSPGTFRDVYISSFDANSGIVQSKVVVAASFFIDEHAPDVGGEELDGFDHVIVAYDIGADIRTSLVQILDDATPVLISTATILDATSAPYDKPAITKSGGGPGVYAVAAQRDYTEDRDIHVALVDYQGTVLGEEAYVTTVGPDEENPDIAGDGEEFLLVFQREGILGDGDNDILARKLVYDSISDNLLFDGFEIEIDADVDDNEVEPAVGLCGGEYLIAWADQYFGGSIYDIYGVSLSTQTCLVCEPDMLIGYADNTMRRPEIGSRQAGGELSLGQAAIAFDHDSYELDEVMFSVWQNDGLGSTIENLGGGCGDVGAVSFDGSLAIGGPGYTVRLNGIDPGASVGLLNLSVPAPFNPCGTCLATPLQWLFVVPTIPTTDGFDEAKKSFGIPCKPTLEGVSLDYQWTVLLTPSSPCPLVANISISDAMRVTLDF